MTGSGTPPPMPHTPPTRADHGDRPPTWATGPAGGGGDAPPSWTRVDRPAAGQPTWVAGPEERPGDRPLTWTVEPEPEPRREPERRRWGLRRRRGADPAARPGAGDRTRGAGRAGGAGRADRAGRADWAGRTRGPGWAGGTGGAGGPGAAGGTGGAGQGGGLDGTGRPGGDQPDLWDDQADWDDQQDRWEDGPAGEARAGRSRGSRVMREGRLATAPARVGIVLGLLLYVLAAYWAFTPLEVPTTQGPPFRCGTALSHPRDTFGRNVCGQLNDRTAMRAGAAALAGIIVIAGGFFVSTPRREE